MWQNRNERKLYRFGPTRHTLIVQYYSLPNVFLCIFLFCKLLFLCSGWADLSAEHRYRPIFAFDWHRPIGKRDGIHQCLSVVLHQFCTGLMLCWLFAIRLGQQKPACPAVDSKKRPLVWHYSGSDISRGSTTCNNFNTSNLITH